jgi:hypothetical protein
MCPVTWVLGPEREYRASQKAERQRDARKSTGPSLHVIIQNTNKAGGLRPPDHPDICVSNSNSKPETQRQEAPACEGLNLSSPGAARGGLSLPHGQRQIGVLPVSSESETLRWQVLQKQAEEIKAKYGVQPCN